MTHFTSIVIQMNGEVKERKRHAWADLQRREANRDIIESFGRLLDKKLPAVLTDVARFCDSLEGTEWQLDWKQPDETSAVATLLVSTRPITTCWFFTGFEPIHDQIAVTLADAMLVEWSAEYKWPVGAGIGSVRDRPLAACMLWPGNSDARELKLAGIASLCLSAAFFRRAASRAAAGNPSLN